MELPNVTQHQIDAMNKAAQAAMEKDGFVVEEPTVPGQTTILNPAMQPVTEPVLYDTQEVQEESEQEQEELEDQVLPEPTIAHASDKEVNFKNVYLAKMKAEKERDALMKKLAQYEEQKQPAYNYVQEAHPTEPDPLDSFTIDDTDLVEGKHIKEILREVKSLRKTVAAQQQQTSRTTQDALDLKLRAQYPDIDKVLTPENIEIFRDIDPDLAETIGNNQDIYKKASLAYKMIKQYGIYKDQTYAPQKSIVAKNQAKPKPMASVSPQQGDSPMSHANAFANGLTSDLKKELNRQMREAMKQF